MICRTVQRSVSLCCFTFWPSTNLIVRKQTSCSALYITKKASCATFGMRQKQIDKVIWTSFVFIWPFSSTVRPLEAANERVTFADLRDVGDDVHDHGGIANATVEVRVLTYKRNTKLTSFFWNRCKQCICCVTMKPRRAFWNNAASNTESCILYTELRKTFWKSSMMTWRMDAQFPDSF